MLENPRTWKGHRVGNLGRPFVVQANFLKAGEGVGEPNRPDAPVMSAGESN